MYKLSVFVKMMVFGIKMFTCFYSIRIIYVISAVVQSQFSPKLIMLQIFQNNGFCRLYTEVRLHYYFCTWLNDRCNTFPSFVNFKKFHLALFACSIVTELCSTVYIFLFMSLWFVLEFLYFFDVTCSDDFFL